MSRVSARGILIDSVPTGENNLVLTIFSKEEGKFSCYAKGANSQKSKRKHHLELLNIIDFQIQKSGKKGEFNLPLLTNINKSEKLIKIDVSDNELSQAYSFGVFIIAEIIKKILPEYEQEQLCFSYLENIQQSTIITAKTEFNLLISYITFKYLITLGYLFDISEYSREIGENADKLKEYELVANLNEPGLRLNLKTDKINDHEIIVPMDIIKIQKFMSIPEIGWDQVRRLSLKPKLTNSLLDLNLHWVESVLEKGLKTKKYLDFVKIKS